MYFFSVKLQYAINAKKVLETPFFDNMYFFLSNCSAKYEPLRSLCDLKTTRDLTNDGVRDLLRRYTRDHGLEVVRLGALEDMSGLNDAFNRYRLFDN